MTWKWVSCSPCVGVTGNNEEETVEAKGWEGRRRPDWVLLHLRSCNLVAAVVVVVWSGLVWSWLKHLRQIGLLTLDDKLTGHREERYRRILDHRREVEVDASFYVHDLHHVSRTRFTDWPDRNGGSHAYRFDSSNVTFPFVYFFHKYMFHLDVDTWDLPGNVFTVISSFMIFVCD